MYKRLLTLPNRSFYLFGPRASGKTTWLKGVLPEALVFDLLDAETLLEITRDLSFFKQQILANPEDRWVVVDEVQRLPRLLDDVHQLLNEHRYRFALSGSRARKLRRMQANMLAGRAITRKFFPLVGAERGFDVPLDLILKYGNLPELSLALDDAVDILDAYVATYLKEEIVQEALESDLDTFSRFLRVAGILNGEMINISSVARDCGVKRTTVEKYYEIAEATLIGARLPPWQPKLKVKEYSKPKFYFFDSGVVRSMTGRVRDPLDSSEVGPLLETVILHELRSAMNYLNTGGELSYWRTASGKEVDFIWSRADTRIGFEVKHSSRWRREYGVALRELLDHGLLSKAFGIYTGDVVLQDGNIQVLPVSIFMKHLSEGVLIAS